MPGCQHCLGDLHRNLQRAAEQDYLCHAETCRLTSNVVKCSICKVLMAVELIQCCSWAAAAMNGGVGAQSALQHSTNLACLPARSAALWVKDITWVKAAMRVTPEYLKAPFVHDVEDKDWEVLTLAAQLPPLSACSLLHFLLSLSLSAFFLPACECLCFCLCQKSLPPMHAAATITIQP